MSGKLGKWGSKVHLLLKKLNKSCYTDKRILRLSFLLEVVMKNVFGMASDFCIIFLDIYYLLK